MTDAAHSTQDRPTDFSSALASVPAAGNRRAIAMPAHLKFFYGPMDCGKSTLALQIDHNHARQGRHGLVLTRYDRSGRPTITTRVGLAHDAIEVTDELDLVRLVRQQWAAGRRVDYLIVDEAGFLNPEHVDQLAELVDESHVDVYCFGLSTDFRSRLLPGAKRLIELADEISAIQVEVLCWCGRPGQQNARVVHNRVVREGDTVVVADTAVDDAVRYQVLCRAHYRSGDLGEPGERVGRGQLTFDDAAPGEPTVRAERTHR
ncbi:thymidine kinase [Jatrophihabitans telluris]|uniref:Thymidine kinase n=1 Tax=Jatrophihabitans telluris TaxID=2038343 RepID=A0ABY4QUX7_9ACTN|nr:thymidine kinase [Jatrophihabitans telluris]UQX86671.1 thymidine kinase [Jatrophihabitans telluris]